MGRTPEAQLQVEICRDGLRPVSSKENQKLSLRPGVRTNPGRGARGGWGAGLESTPSSQLAGGQGWRGWPPGLKATSQCPRGMPVTPSPLNCPSRMNLWRGVDSWVRVLQRRGDSRQGSSGTKVGYGQRWGFCPALNTPLNFSGPSRPAPHPELPCGPWPQ